MSHLWVTLGKSCTYFSTSLHLGFFFLYLISCKNLRSRKLIGIEYISLRTTGMPCLRKGALRKDVPRSELEGLRYLWWVGHYDITGYTSSHCACGCGKPSWSKVLNLNPGHGRTLFKTTVEYWKQVKNTHRIACNAAFIIMKPII